VLQERSKRLEQLKREKLSFPPMRAGVGRQGLRKAGDDRKDAVAVAGQPVPETHHWKSDPPGVRPLGGRGERLRHKKSDGFTARTGKGYRGASGEEHARKAENKGCSPQPNPVRQRQLGSGRRIPRGGVTSGTKKTRTPAKLTKAVNGIWGKREHYSWGVKAMGGFGEKKKGGKVDSSEMKRSAAEGGGRYRKKHSAKSNCDIHL